MSALKPLADKVVIEPMQAEEKTTGGIYLPDSAKKKPQQGKVIAVGDGKVLENGQRVQLSVKVGDEVLYSKYGGNEVNIGGNEYTILEEDQIYAIINN